MADSNTPILDLLDMETGSHDNDWGDQVDAILLTLENAIKASRATATTGGTTALTKDTAKEHLQRVTGILTSNAVIEVPNVASRWIFSNETTGAYTVTVKVSGQTGVAVPQGSAMLLRGNGTDVVAVNAPQPRGIDQKATAVSGTVDALVLTMSPAMTSYTPGAIVRWTSPGVNTVTNPTINASGLGNITIKKGANAALAVGDTGVSGYLCEGEINADSTAIILKQPATSATILSNDNVFIGLNSFDAALLVSGGPAFVQEPGGKLTFAAGSPIMASDNTAATTVYYTPYKHNAASLYDGTRWKTHFFTELNQTLSDSTKSPAAAAVSSLYDMFLWDDSGTKRCTRGPVWDAATAGSSDRGTGVGTTELELFHGVLVNKYDITNGPLARRGLYVGTIGTNATGANGQMNWQVSPTAESGGTNNRLDCYNHYHKVRVSALNRDSANSWNYSTNTFRPYNGASSNVNNRITVVTGQQEDAINVDMIGYGSTGSAGLIIRGGIGVNVTDAISGLPSSATSNLIVALISKYRGVPTLGLSFYQMLEAGSGTQGVFYGDNSDVLQSGLYVDLMM